MISASEINDQKSRVLALAGALKYCGFECRVWRDQRVYLHGYGRDITAYLEPFGDEGLALADGARLDVRSNWQAAKHNGLRCKGVKHAILKDLWAARLVTTPPPEKWQDVMLVEPRPDGRAIRPFDAQNTKSA